MNKKSNEDQGFEIIKENITGAPRMGNPFGFNPSLSSMAALMQGGNMSNINNLSSLLQAGNMSGLINQSSMLQKCE